jgi:hypothetical protein
MPTSIVNTDTAHIQRENLHHLDANPGTPDTPRTSSQSTIFSLQSSDEPFQFDADSRSASLRSINSMNEATHPNGPHVPSKFGRHATISEHPQHLDGPVSMDPDFSMVNIIPNGLTSSIIIPEHTVKLVDPPLYIASGDTPTISPIGYSIPARRQSRVRQVYKVQPLVYSAIGSLESVNNNSLGSFNHRLRMSRSKKTKNEKVDVDATTSRINKRIIHKPKKADTVDEKSGINLSNTEHQSKATKSISALSTTLASNTDNKNLISGENVKTPTVKTTEIAGNAINFRAGVRDKVEEIDRISIKSELEPIIKPKRKISGKKKKVTIESKPREIKHVELFRPSCDAYTPRMGKKIIKFKPAEERMNMKESVGNALGTIQKPNFKDALRRVAMIIQQHIVKIERRFEASADNSDLFDPAMRDAFAEDNFVTPRYICTMVKLPMARAGVVYGMRKIRVAHHIPTADDIYQFGHRLFNQVQLSSECSIICLIYVERIMEIAKVPVMATTWKPIFMCGLLLASKVWQDWSSWNIEFANVYPQFSLESINRLEIQFLKMVKWDLYISSSLYAKYYFALRSLLEKQNFRRRYVRMVGGVDHVAASQAVKISKRSELLKEKSLAFLSSSV